MTKLYVKTTIPTVEQTVKAIDGTSELIAGIKLYSAKELKDLSKKFGNNLVDVKLTRAQKELAKLFQDMETPIEELETKVTAIQAEIEKLSEQQAKDYLAFIKSQVVYLKNVSLVTVDNETQEEKELIIKDTREVDPIESLWASPSECLAVLLDMYLDSAAFKDSFPQAVSSTVFDPKSAIKFNEGKVKN